MIALFRLNLCSCQARHLQVVTQDLHILKTNPLGSCRPSGTGPAIAFIHDVCILAITNTVVDVAVVKTGIGRVRYPASSMVLSRINQARGIDGGLKVSVLVPIEGYIGHGDIARNGRGVRGSPYHGGCHESCRENSGNKHLARSVTAKTASWISEYLQP